MFASGSMSTHTFNRVQLKIENVYDTFGLRVLKICTVIIYAVYEYSFHLHTKTYNTRFQCSTLAF